MWNLSVLNHVHPLPWISHNLKQGQEMDRKKSAKGEKDNAVWHNWWQPWMERKIIFLILVHVYVRFAYVFPLQAE